MRKRISVVLIICSLALYFASCGHDHEWKEATYENPKECVKCGEISGQSIKDMLAGKWKSVNDGSSIYFGIEFTNNGFTGGTMAYGDLMLAKSGVVNIDGNYIKLTDNNGELYYVFTYKITESSVELTSHDGEKWEKINN